MADWLPLMDTPSATPKASDLISASLLAFTVTVPSAVTPESSITARSVFLMSLMVRETPRPTSTAEPLVPIAMARLATPAVASMAELSSALTLTAPLLFAAVVKVLLVTRACVLLRILLTPAVPARATEKAEPLVDALSAAEPAMPTLRILAVLSDSTLMSPPTVTVDWSISAQTKLSFVSVPILLMAKAPPTAPVAAVLLPDLAKETDNAPAPAVISESLVACTVTASGNVTVLMRKLAVVSPVMSFVEPEPAADKAMPDFWSDSAAASAPATVKALMLPVASAMTPRSPWACGSQVSVLLSTFATVSPAISLIAMAKPMDTAVELPEEPPL